MLIQKYSVRNPMHSQRGLSMVELMVGMVIALIATIVIFQVFAVSEERKRRTTAASDAGQNSLIAQFQLTRMVEAAGGGMSETPQVIGCPLVITRGGTSLSPAGTFPDPFGTMVANFGTLRPVPFVALDGGTGSDSFMVVGGNSNSSNTSLAFTQSVTDTQLLVGDDRIKLANTQGLLKDDFVFAVERRGVTATPTGTLNTCVMGRITSSATATPNSVTTGLSGGAGLGNPQNSLPNPVELAAAGAGASVYNVNKRFATQVVSAPQFGAGYSANSVLVNLGDQPVMHFVGVDATGRLVIHDLLQRTGTAVSEPIADNVVAMKVLYGVAGGATVNSPLSGQVVPNDITTWVKPTGSYAASTLMAGTFGAIESVGRVKAVRIALITRSSQIEKEQVGPASITLFPDITGQEYTRTFTGTERQYRYQTVDFTVPLRNVRCLFAPLRGCAHDSP